MLTMHISADLLSISESRIWQHMLKPVSIISQTLSSPNNSPPGPDIIISISFKIRNSTTSSWAESDASNRQCVMAEDKSCMARASLGEFWLMR
jgi:hypothetical protein